MPRGHLRLVLLTDADHGGLRHRRLAAEEVPSRGSSAGATAAAAARAASGLHADHRRGDPIPVEYDAIHLLGVTLNAWKGRERRSGEGLKDERKISSRPPRFRGFFEYWARGGARRARSRLTPVTPPALTGCLPVRNATDLRGEGCGRGA